MVKKQDSMEKCKTYYAEKIKNRLYDFEVECIEIYHIFIYFLLKIQILTRDRLVLRNYNDKNAYLLA